MPAFPLTKPHAAWVRVVCAVCLLCQVYLLGAQPALAVTGSELVAQGRDIMRQARRDTSFIDDPLLTQYLSNLNQRLRQHAPVGARDQLDPRGYAFFLADPKFNAFALPGGYIGINTGVLANLEHEDEFAAVMAHENAHVMQNHIGRLMERSDITPWLVGAALLAAIARGGDQAGTAGVVASQAYGVQSQLNFSREMETEADRIGMRMLTGAGFPGSAMVRAFELLMRAERLNDTGDFPFLRSHPLVPTRITDMQERMGNRDNASTPQPSADADADFAFIRARALLLAAQSFNRSAELEQQLPQQRLSPAALNYAKAWFAWQHGAREPALASLNQIDSATLGNHARACIALLRASVLPEQALGILEQALARDSGNLALRDAWVQALINQGQAARAVSTLRDWLGQERSQPLWWKRLAQAQQSQGHEQAALGARAELLLLQDEPQDALGVLRTALTLPASDPIEAAVIQARLKELERSRDNPNTPSTPR